MKTATEFHARVEDDQPRANVHLSEEAILASDYQGGSVYAFVSAAHNWMDEALEEDRHDQDVCDYFCDFHDYVVELEDGRLRFIVVDSLGKVWCFLTAPLDENKFLPYLPEDQR